jgi:hypothetical protein
MGFGRSRSLMRPWNRRVPAAQSNCEQPTLASISASERGSISNMKAIEGTSRIKAVTAAIW